MFDRNPATAVVAQRNKLQLHDLRAMDVDSLPNLRASQSLETSPTVDAAVRDQAAKDWQAIQAQPDDIIKERKEVALAREQLHNTLQERKGLIAQLQNVNKQLETERAQRLHHPMVYGMGAALLGMTGLWLYQRRKNQAKLHPHGTDRLIFDAQLNLKNGPDADDLVETNKAEFLSTLHTTPSLETQPNSLQLPWYKKLLSGKSPNPRHPLSITDTHTQNVSHYSDSMDTHIASSLQSDVSDSDYLDPEFVKDEILVHSTLVPAEGQSTISYLYELRATVQALTTIEQEDAARDLLLRHIDALPNTSAWAYLEYLSMCSSADDREAFESMRQRFRVQFNRLAPYWLESPDSQRDLLGHERAIAEITAVWPSQRALTLIENWLTDSAQERRIFQLTAYDDLFDLYDILTQLEEVQDELDFLPTVSLLDLDFEFAMDFKLEAEPEGTARAVPTVKTGDFVVDFNIGFSQSVPAAIQ